ncbi:exocyst complex component exo84, partial [Linderina macrospora]
MANLVKIVNRAETLIFAFARVEAKKEFVMMIDHAKSTLFSLDAMAVPPMPPIRGVPTRSVKSGVSTQLGSIVEDETDARGASNKARFDEMLDALDIHIARREFEESTALVLDLKQHLEAAPNKGPESVREAVEAHIAELARLILADLLIPCSPRKQVSANVELLHRLGWDKEAKEAFLASRSATIKNRTRQLKLEGNTRLYIRELAVVYFRLIRNTCEWYSEFFLDPTMISALIAWVRQEMAGYAAIFRRHVFHEMQKFQIIASCLKHTLVEVEILGHAGLDLKFMLDQEFFPDLTGCIRSYETRCIAMLGKAVNEDSLAIASKITASTEELVKMFGNQIPIIAAVSKLDEVLGDFGNELRYIVRDSLYGQSVASVTAIIEGVLKHLLTALRRSNLTYAQEFALLASTQAIVSWVIPRSATQLDRVFGRTVTDIHNLEQRLEAFPASLQDVFCQKQSVAIARATFDFVTTDFNDDNEVTDNMTPSQEMEKLLLTLGVVARELDSWPAMPKRSILSGIIDCLFVQMIEPRNWETSKGEKRRFSHFGVHRLVLDIHFLLRVCGSLVSKGTNDMANRVCEKGLRAYFAANRSKGAEMKNRPWYDARVMETMQRLGFGFPQFGKGFEHRALQSFEGASPANSAAASRGNSASPATSVS